MRSPFPSAAQAYAESVDSATASRHHPDARLTILPLPSLAALYPLEHSSLPSSLSPPPQPHRPPPLHALPLPDPSNPRFHPYRPAVPPHRLHNHNTAPSSYNSFDSRRQKTPPMPTTSIAPSTGYIGTSMESLLDAIEVHPALSASGSPSRSPSPASHSGYSSTSTGHSSAPTSPGSSPILQKTVTQPSSNKGRMAISLLLDNNDDHHDRIPSPQPQQHQRRPSPTKPKRKSLSPIPDISKRKWSNLSSANFEEERNAKIRRSIQDHVSAQARQSAKMHTVANNVSGGVVSRQSFDSMDPSTRYQMTTICCLHASVAQKSYGAEKRFLCPPPIVHIQAPQDGAAHSGLSSKPQVTMSVICDSGDNANVLGQRATLEDDNTGAFRYLYVTGSAKAKSFQLKLKVYGRACLPNGFVSNDSMTRGSEAEESAAALASMADLPEPYAVFDSAPVAIISKPSKKTAKARNVSSCIVAGSLVSLFNRINSQTVRTKYMSVQDGEFCAKSSSWSAFSFTILSNGPCGAAARFGANANGAKAQQRQQAIQTSTPISYGAEIILTETSTGLKSDRLIVCKVENGRILENATGPICQMQKVALMSTERNDDGQAVYLSAVGNDHQVGRYMDHSTNTKTMLRYQPSTMTGNMDIMKPGSDDFLCWTIVGISKFEYTYFESLPAAVDPESPQPITPFPTLMKNPIYNAASNTLELVVSNFYSKSSSSSSSNEVPMNVWLGSRGPLTTHVIRRNTSNGEDGAMMDQTTLLVDLPQGKHLGVPAEETTLSLPLLFVRDSDGITYNSRAKIVFARSEDSNNERWTVTMA
ncbi:hypothetical protein BGW38_001767 [Lunasporangiospora selenospora]|uniref:Uncharacterized protein n=1 Tax=Lunasporangiospora selenospora TaxID=979761 RepID=A0A9P6FV49_9FUNG|nr:hypothetical protein BGW38_001767 [Lunasporangiospora selenospora]